MTEPASDSALEPATDGAVEPSIAVLISGRGSNLQSIIDAIGDGRLHARIAVVMSNRSDAAGLERARQTGIDTLVMSHRNYASREAYDLAVVEELRKRRVVLVVLAGFMRLLSPPFIAAYPNAILNIHPSLLPAFPGVDGQRQALEYGVKVTGATVHLVTAELDGGPIIRQATVPVLADDTVDTLSTRILEQEHRIYPEAIAEVLAGRWSVEGRRFVSATANPRGRDETPDRSATRSRD